MSFEKYIKKNNLGIVKKNITFKQLTTMKVGGKIKYVYYPSNVVGLREAIKYLNLKKIEYLFIGNGSNIVASERKFKGVVIHSKYLPHTMNIKDDVLTVTAFYDLRRLVAFTSERQKPQVTSASPSPYPLSHFHLPPPSLHSPPPLHPPPPLPLLLVVPSLWPVCC